MKKSPLHWLVVSTATCAFLKVPNTYAKAGEGYDLDPDTQIRIGIKKRSKNCSKKTKSGDRLSVHYVGKLYKNDEQFDSSRDRQEPFQFTVGRQNVMKGWDQGLLGMCIGEVRKLVIPSNLAYGEVGALPDVKSGATLIFEVELLDILPDGIEYDDDDNSYYGSISGDKLREQMELNRVFNGNSNVRRYPHADHEF